MKKLFGILVSLVVLSLFICGCGGGNGSGGQTAQDVTPAETAYQYSASDMAGTWTITGSQHAITVTFNGKGDITYISNGACNLITCPPIQPYSSTRFGVKANGSVSGREYFYDPGKNTVTWTVTFKSKTVMKGVITWVCPADGWDKKYSVTVTKK